MTYGLRLLRWRTLGAITFALCTILTRVPTHAQQPQPVFEPGMEGEIWKTQPPDKIGRRVQPPCIPESAWTWNEELAYYEAENSCSPEELWDQEEAQGRHDQLLFPAGVAVYEPTPQALANGFPTGRRILVADRYNHRMLVFLPGPNGSWIPLANSSNQADLDEVAAADWNGGATSNFPESMIYPEHLTVDKGGYVWVADLGRGRVDVFTPRGNYVTAFYTKTVDETVGLYPYGVAVNDDAEYGVGGRVAVVAQDYFTQGTHLIVIDAATLTEVGRHAPDPFVGELDDPGAFNLGTAVDYHRTGGVDRLVVADTNNNRIQVFPVDSNGAPQPTPVLIFGATELIHPTTGQPISESRLQWPYSVHVDDRGRVLVSDSIGNRETFFSVNFSGTPSVSFLYELNARGGLNGVPRGVAEDSNHSLYIVDTGNHEVEVFEIPELAIVDVDLLPQSPRVGDTVAVEFSVLVPETKSMVPNVTPSCDVGSGPLTFVSGPTAIDGTPSGAVNISPVPAGGVYRYRCEFQASASGPFDVEVGASGGPSGTEVTAPVKIAASAVVDCGGTCESDPPSIAGAVTDPAAVNGFYPADATITLTARDRRTHGVDPSGIKRIYWKWVSSSAMNLLPVDPALACPGQPAPTQCIEYDSPAGQQIYEVFATLDGVSTLEFWTEDFHGNLSERSRVGVAVDTAPPEVVMNFRTPPTGGSSWFTGDVFIDLTFSDPLGLTPSSQIVTTPPNTTAFHFTQEGRLQSQSVNVTDLAGNTWPEPLSSADFVEVNIDRGKPQTTASSAQGLLANNQVFQDSAPPEFELTAIDPILSTGEEGSGVGDSVGEPLTFFRMDGGPQQRVHPSVTITATTLGPHTLEYWSFDFAGNEETHNVRNFWINAKPVAHADSVSTAEDTTADFNVLANDTDENNNPTVTETLSVTGLTQPASGGTVSLNSNGTVKFVPATNFNGTTTFTYRASDQHGGVSDPVTVTVDVTPVNDPPVAVDDTALTDDNVMVDIPVLANDTDIDTPHASLTIDVASLSDPAHGTAIVFGNAVRYIPDPGYSGPDSFTYRASDGASLSNAATVRVNVRSTSNQPPVCDNAFGGEIWPPNHKKFQAVKINGVTDPEGQTITFLITNIVQDEPTDTTGDGKFSPDASGVGTANATVRAERMGSGNGRVYRISFTATDALGGSCTGTVDYTVPHDQGQKSTAIAGTTWYDSTVHVPGTRDK